MVNGVGRFGGPGTNQHEAKPHRRAGGGNGRGEAGSASDRLCAQAELAASSVDEVEEQERRADWAYAVSSQLAGAGSEDMRSGREAARVLGEMAERGMDDQLSLVLTPVSGERATMFTIASTPHDPGERSLLFRSPSAAVRHATDLAEVAQGEEEVWVAAHSPSGTRDVLARRAGDSGLRYLSPVDLATPVKDLSPGDLDEGHKWLRYHLVQERVQDDPAVAGPVFALAREVAAEGERRRGRA